MNGEGATKRMQDPSPCGCYGFICLTHWSHLSDVCATWPDRGSAPIKHSDSTRQSSWLRVRGMYVVFQRQSVYIDQWQTDRLSALILFPCTTAAIHRRALFEQWAPRRRPACTRRSAARPPEQHPPWAPGLHDLQIVHTDLTETMTQSAGTTGLSITL